MKKALCCVAVLCVFAAVTLTGCGGGGGGSSSGGSKQPKLSATVQVQGGSNQNK